jgi:hypothetical protein
MRRQFAWFCSIPLVVLISACASSPGGAPPDAEVVEPPDAGPPDAVPCIPDPDGVEDCDGVDDDCDGTTDEGYPGIGEPCESGVGTCVNAGVTVCTPDGVDVECGAEPLEPGTELCGTGEDEDCDEAIDEGFPDLGQPCSVGTGACFAQGVMVCSSTGLSTQCNAVPNDGTDEVCNGADDDCDTFIDEDFDINTACDGGGDTDLCAEGVWVCDGGGGRTCTDNTGSTVDMCGNGDDDCNPGTADGSGDGEIGTGCDGAQDTDACLEGAWVCSGGQKLCTDNTGSTVDHCGGGDEDCNPGTEDGSGDPDVGDACDGLGDSDLCFEGVIQCIDEEEWCSDATGSTIDYCGNGDEDCDPNSDDGDEDPDNGDPCDGPNDTDLCQEGVWYCNNSGQELCTDASGSTVELCDGTGANEDCDGATDEGWNVNSNPVCSGNSYLGSWAGDEGDGANPRWSGSGVGERWYRYRLTENADSDTYLSSAVYLWSPAGIDYDLYLHCSNCGSFAQQSIVDSTGGHWDIVRPRWEDDWWGEDDSYDVTIEIRYWTGNCAPWSLYIYANNNLDGYANTCDP